MGKIMLMVPAEASAGLSQITDGILGMFKDVQAEGVKVVLGAIALGVVFLGGKWLWGKAKQWVSKV